MKKQLLVAGAVTTIGAAALAGGAAVHAETATSTSSTNPMSGLVSAIANKFHLNEADVQKVVDDQRSQMQQERETELKDEIAQLVKDGKLTQAQVDAINAKRTNLEKQRQATMSQDETKSSLSSDRKAQQEARKTELDQWLKDNGIDAKYAYLVMGGRGGHGGPGDHDGPDEANSSSSSTSSSSSSTSSAS